MPGPFHEYLTVGEAPEGIPDFGPPQKPADVLPRLESLIRVLTPRLGDRGSAALFGGAWRWGLAVAEKTCPAKFLERWGAAPRTREGVLRKLRALRAELARPRTRRARRPRKPRPLTPRQAEVVQVVGECKGDIAAAARRLGRDRTTIAESYRTALAKLGKQAVRHGRRLFPRDRRGQVDVSADEDSRRL